MTCDDAYVSAYVYGTHKNNEEPLAAQTARKLNSPLFLCCMNSAFL